MPAASTAVDFRPGALVRVRGREWVVLPESTDEVLMVRPLGGLDDETTAVIRAIEDIAPASFGLPDPSQPGDYHACRLLRDAARISTRAAAGPFRSFGRIAVEPRPYQLVPLLMALKLETVRLLIADDVGIGKTIEACLVARELIDRGEISSMAVVCPPHLAEQWQKELAEKFHIEAELVLSSTIQRLERHLRIGESVFTHHKFVVVSTDFVKQLTRRTEFIQHCPELLIVDEAHGCTISGHAGKVRQNRHDLIRDIAINPNRHLVLVTATPHSGNESAFRSLLTLLHPKFADLPEDLGDDERSVARRELAKHLVQRRRKDIEAYLGANTAFPRRLEKSESYTLSSQYKNLFEKVLSFAAEIVGDESGNKRQRRVRWWSALSLLRAMASSPAAAVATLKNRAATAAAADEAEADELGRRAVMDEDENDSAETLDFTPGGDASEESPTRSLHDRLLTFAGEAQELLGAKDSKLQSVVKIIRELLDGGFNPILFCRFIDTADYIADHLRKALERQKVEVASVTGVLAPAERETRIEQLGKSAGRRVLVCTDCLSEGVNLQAHFDAVVHYDLSWNPTRHEQREGRIDRFGQRKPEVRVVTYFGKDNKIDGVVLDVLIEKHKKIKSALGVAVAVPGSSEEIVEALFQGMLLRRGDDDTPLLPGFDAWLKPKKEQIHADWEDALARETKSRSRFAQHAIKTEEVSAELAAVREAIGAGPATRQFIDDVLYLAGIPTMPRPNDRLVVQITNEAPRNLRHAIGREEAFTARFDLPVNEGEVYLSRTHPITEALASWVLDMAMDPVEAAGQKAIARRCGVTRTISVKEKTTLLLVRFRYHLLTRTATGEQRLLAEEIRPLAFRGSPADPAWLPDDQTDPLLAAAPSGNVLPSMVTQQLTTLVDRLPQMESHLSKIAVVRSKAVLDAHIRVRESAKLRTATRIEPVLPVDLLGCFILLPNE